MNTYLEWEDGIKFQVRENKTAPVCGALAVIFALFILVMSIRHPSGRGGGALLYLPLLCMLLGGAACFFVYVNRKLIVEEDNLCYVNWIGKSKQFTLDEIGYCKMGVGGNMNRIAVYDLVGDKLCKLDYEMRGMAEFYQYLFDNGIRIEWNESQALRSSKFMNMIAALSKESSVCGEEIRKYSEHLYEEVDRIFHDWENLNKHFKAIWEFGFAEYTAQDLEKECRMWERTGSVGKAAESLPESYECVLEAYLKTEDGYVMTGRGEAVSIMLPYLSRTRSYRVGEKERIRKTDEDSLKEWLEWQLESLSNELPKHRYHTETFVMGHELRTAAGIAAKDALQ